MSDTVIRALTTWLRLQSSIHKQKNISSFHLTIVLDFARFAEGKSFWPDAFCCFSSRSWNRSKEKQFPCCVH